MKLVNNLKTNMELIGSFILIAILTAAVRVISIFYTRQVEVARFKLSSKQHTVGGNGHHD